jgi:hypothetical protein
LIRAESISVIKLLSAKYSFQLRVAKLVVSLPVVNIVGILFVLFTVVVGIDLQPASNAHE